MTNLSHIFSRSTTPRSNSSGADRLDQGTTDGRSPSPERPSVRLMPEGRRITVLHVKDAERRDHDHCDTQNIHSLADLERQLGRAVLAGDEFTERRVRLAIRSRVWRASHDPFGGAA